MKIDANQLFEVVAGGPQEGLNPAEVTHALGLGRDKRARSKKALDALVARGVLAREGPRYRLARKTSKKRATVSGILRVTPGGRGFIAWDEAEDDILVYPEAIGAAVDGDTVEAEVWRKADGRRQGTVVAIKARGRTRVTGTLSGPPWRLTADDVRLPPLEVSVQGADETLLHQGRGQVVVADIVTYPTRSGDALQVSPTRVLGPVDHLRTALARALVSQGIEEAFPSDVLQEAETAARARMLADDVRQDFRHVPFVTCDPADARDFDDAVSAEVLPRGAIRVWVAIADVSAYVRPHSLLDQEACRRGCSIYLPDRAIPMLPDALSSDACSLKPHEDRPALVVRFDVDSKGKARDAACWEGMIHSRARLEYGGVGAVLARGARGRWASYRDVLAQLELLRDVAQRLGQRRKQRGSLFLDLPEVRVELDEDDPERVRNIAVAKSSDEVKTAYALVEELMIAANEAVGQVFVREAAPTLWRIHGAPEPKAREALSLCLATYGVTVDPEDSATPKGMAQVMAKLKDHPAAMPLAYLVLRTLKQAVYATDNKGHFGLASRAYLHFTSPIRRYPDLIVHRQLKHLLRGERDFAGTLGRTAREQRTALDTIAEHASARERQAMEVERQAVSIYAATFMRDRIGDVFAGAISAVTSFGFFVRLDAPAVEGLVKLESFSQRVTFDPLKHRLRGPQRTFSLGDRVTIRVTGVTPARGQIDFALVA